MGKEKSRPSAFRIIVLCISTLFAILFLLVIIPKIISDLSGTTPELPPDRQWEGNVMYMMSILFIIGYAIGWWRLVWGGLIIILSAFIVTVPFIIVQGNMGALIFGIPQLIIGLLYLLLNRSEKKKTVNDG